MALSEEVVDDYKMSLIDLSINSKPLINMLTMLAEDHEQHAPEIVKVIEDHIYKCKREKKLPALYLLDSIMKNLEKTSYKSLFSKNIVQTFTSVFEQVDEKTRASMFKLRQTWSAVLPNAILYRIDKKINSLLDPAWPITATEPEQTSIHVNPRFLHGKGSESEHSSPEVVEDVADDSEDQEALMRQQLIAKQQELLSLKQARLELELAETAEKLRKKQGEKGAPIVTSSAPTPLSLPLPSTDDTIPEEIAKPRDPRPRPTDPRRRDPRLQNKVEPTRPAVPAHRTVPDSAGSSVQGHGAFQGINSVPPNSSQSTFPPVHSQGPFPPGQHHSAGIMPFNGPQGPGIPYQPMIGMPPIAQGHFSGEVYVPEESAEESAKFSDENDSDSSRSSWQSHNNTRIPSQSNVRDPRTHVEHRRTDNNSRVDPRTHHSRHRGSDKPIHKHSSVKQVASTKDTHKESRDPRISHVRESQEKRKSKDREAHVPSKQMREALSQSPRKNDQQSSKHRSVSKERENKSDSKLKDAFEIDRKRKEEEKKKFEAQAKRKTEEKLEKLKARLSVEKEKSPQKSPKDLSSKIKDLRERKSDEQKYIRTESSKAEVASNNKKGNSKSEIRKRDTKKSPDVKQKSVKKIVQSAAADIDENKRLRKEKSEKRCSSDGADQDRLIKKIKLEKPFPDATVALDEKQNEVDAKGSELMHDVKDIDLKQEDMDVDSEQDTGNEENVPKIDDEISDLFGGEDEDYRPSVQKHPLPLKSPSSKGWDQFKASQPEHYAYDIELKKHRQDSVTGSDPFGLDEEPQDEDLRVLQPEFSRQVSGVDSVEIPKELAMNQHGDIFLRAHKQLKDGLISHEQHQELLKQLTQLMQIQQLQEQNRRLSGEVLPLNDQALNSESRNILSPTRDQDPEMPVREPVREIRSPDRPLETFKIPKKSRERAEEEDRRKELSNLYPESPQEDRYRGQGPFTSRESGNRVEGDVPPPERECDVKELSKDRPWREQDRRRPPRTDNDRREPAAFTDPELPSHPQEHFSGPPAHRGPGDIEFNRRGPPDERRGPYRDEFPENRRPRPDGPADDFDNRRQIDYDRRGPPDRFDDASNLRDPRGPYRDDRRPEDWNDGLLPDRRDGDVPPDQRGQRFRGPGRDFERRGRDENVEYFDGPHERMGYPDEGNRSPNDPEWRDVRRPEIWRENDADHGNFDDRGPQGRFREGRNTDRRGPSGPNDIHPDMRGPPERSVGRGRPDRRDQHGDRRGGPQGDRRHGKDENQNAGRSPSDWDEGPQPWNDRGDDMRGPPLLEGPFGPPGNPVEGSGPWFPRGRRGDSPNKEPWRGPHDKMHPSERQRPHDGPPRHGHRDDRPEENFEPYPEKPKPLMSLLDAMPIRPPRGLLKPKGDPRMQGFGPRGPPRFDGPRFDGPRFDGPRPQGPPDMMKPVGPLHPPSDSYVDKFGDPRFRCFVDIGPVVSEEVIIGRRNFEIKLGAPPRKIPWGKDFIEVFADPSKRGIVIDNNLMYKFGERVKDVTIRGRKEKLFYHGRPLSMWIDGQHYEIRVDAPPKSINVDGKMQKIQIDGRDMMILIDKEEKGRYGGEPRFVFIDEVRKEIRFEPPPRHILIDGNLCELKLNMQQPCVNIKGVYHGIRFDGPPRDVFINGKLYQIFTDHAVKLRVGNRFHYVALGGPCHEIIIDGKWFEMKFNEAPSEVNVGNQVLMVRLPGSPPEVKILPEIAQEPRPIPPGMQGPMRPGMPMPGPMGMVGPRGPNIGLGGPQGPVMPMPGMGPPGMLGPMQPPVGPMQHQTGPLQQPQMHIPQITTSAMSLSGAPIIPGISQSVAGTQAVQSSVPNVLSSLFPPVPQTSSASAPIDINSLFAKLVNTGIIKKEAETKPEPAPPAAKPEVVKPPEYVLPQKKEPKVEEKFEDIPDMTEMNPNEMKSLPVGMVQRLYSGIQCTSCGERFTLKDGEKTEKYRQHLDWHFRQNRRGKTDMKLTSCRKWYYGTEDWIQYEEIADTEDSGKSNFFEQQQQPGDTTPTSSQTPLTLVVPEGVSVIRCPPATGNDNEDMCNICFEVFEQYWNEDLEEWHLRDAIKVNNKTYHPICYEDHTDVSEGTPSPSALSVVEPSYMSRKSLTYDEASQDGHHASFEEERKISTDTKESMDTAVSETSAEKVHIKTEPQKNTVETVKIKQEPESEKLPDIKEEPELMKNTEIKKEKEEIESESHDQTDSVKQPDISGLNTVVKTELLEDSEIVTEISTEIPMDTCADMKREIDERTAEPAQEGVTGQTEGSDEKEETAMETSDTHVSENITIKESEETSDTPVSDIVAIKETERTSDTPISDVVAIKETERTSDTPISDIVAIKETEEKSDTPVSENVELMESEAENVSESVRPNLQVTPDPENQVSANVEESISVPVENQEDMAADSEQETESNSQPNINTELATSGIHVSTSPRLSVPSEPTVCESQHSPTYSKLSKIKLVIPQDPPDITPEVFEIGSNASTPTQDELPSPLGEDSGQ